MDHGSRGRLARGPGHADHAATVEPLDEKRDLRGDGDARRTRGGQVLVGPGFWHRRVGHHQIACSKVVNVMTAQPDFNGAGVQEPSDLFQ